MGTLLTVNAEKTAVPRSQLPLQHIQCHPPFPPDVGPEILQRVLKEVSRPLHPILSTVTIDSRLLREIMISPIKYRY